MSVLGKLYFYDEPAAFTKLEDIVWPSGPICPHCGATERVYKINGESTRIGLKKCGHCRKQFTVKVGTVFESSHVQLYKWFQAAYLMSCSKNGVSAYQLHHVLEVTYKTARFMARRLREAMAMLGMEPMGGEVAIFEVDETFIGSDYTVRSSHAVVALCGIIGKRLTYMDSRWA